MSILQEVSKTPAGSQSTVPDADITARYFEKSGNWYSTLVHQQTPTSMQIYFTQFCKHFSK